ncbi:restriction endonuclease subunit S [Winogradskyella aquimaris]|uniref:Restriction endonuclease subunit S n=1 Tax=Winogradskyella aquimaris TaxID=864074 RepID=A0ABU5EP18_9FLAO|nr:restriction endonuclease subunit S [Winogradskyella aquimaris]MDY2588204.1 restriction endonuclease subunit S [Winogradskyella aquimaris]
MNTETLHTKTEKQLVPQLRFAEFEENWETSLFDDLVFIVNGQVDPKIEPYCHYPHIGPGNMSSMTGELLAYRTAKEDQQTSGKYLFNEDHVLYGKINPQLGKVVFPKFIGVCSADTYPIECKKQKLTPYFLKCLLMENRFYKYSVSVSRRTGMPKINREELSAFRFRYPTLPEQQKIASFLSSVDTKLQQLTQKKELLVQYKKGVMQQLFSQQLRFKQKDGSDYPDWEEKKLGEVAERMILKNTDNQITFVLTNSAIQGIVSQQDYFDKDIANQSNLQGYYIVSKDDFVYNPRISTSAPVGPIKRNKLQKGVMSPLYSIFRFNEPLLEYFEHYFETTNWHKYLHSVANFGARHDRMNITNSDFYKMPIPMPCFEEREQIANYLSGLDTKIETLAQQITQTQQFKKGLLQQMFV